MFLGLLFTATFWGGMIWLCFYFGSAWPLILTVFGILGFGYASMFIQELVAKRQAKKNPTDLRSLRKKRKKPAEK
ncbi:MAG: hypothetical protein VX730_01845 [Pseudomonadota bacterium]|nr:hypothetical protein [Pseudomonadota bacterium]